MSGKVQYTDLRTKREGNSAKVEPNGVKHDHVSGSQTNSSLTPLTGSNYSDAGERKKLYVPQGHTRPPVHDVGPQEPLYFT